MPKVLFVEAILSGHHLSYLLSLIDIEQDSAVCLPNHCDNILTNQYIIKSNICNILLYYKWIKSIKEIIKQYNPEIIHFLYGDALYRYFGLFLSFKQKVIVTCHQIRYGIIRKIALKKFASKVDKIVVHTFQNKKELQKIGINNVLQIEYPNFNKLPECKYAKEKIGIPNKYPVILCLGGTRYDKGLDILLEALKSCIKPFYLIIAGNEEYFKRDFIERKIVKFKNNVKLVLKFLDDNEFSMYLNASNIICLPYRKIFNGASGPLGEGVRLNKMIIGPNHGSLGQIIKYYHLGMTFEAENSNSLCHTLDKALSFDWKPDNMYYEYKKILSPERFKNDYKKLYNSIID